MAYGMHPFTKEELRAAYALMVDSETATVMAEGPAAPHRERLGFSLDLTTLSLLSLLSPEMDSRVAAFMAENDFGEELQRELSRIRARIKIQLGLGD